LPKPTEAKARLLIFDGDCGFCTTTANWIVEHSSVEVAAKPNQWTDLEPLGLTRDEAEAKVQLVWDGLVYSGHKCFAKLLMIQRNPLIRLVGRIVNSEALDGISSLGYDWVAKNRHRLPGGTPACKMPPSV
jgi:predicted DCC family thiol-disulfide oxidoreductase YuxK